MVSWFLINSRQREIIYQSANEVEDAKQAVGPTTFNLTAESCMSKTGGDGWEGSFIRFCDLAVLEVSELGCWRCLWGGCALAGFSSLIHFLFFLGNN